MPSITPAQVRHMAKLARLRLTDQEVECSVQELTSILGFVDVLRDVDTKNVEPMTGVTLRQAQGHPLRGMTEFESPLREDMLRDSSTSPDALLACSPLPLVQHQIQTPAAHG